MKIGELAAKAGCRTVTVRYYEQAGLIKEAPRSEAGYRLYGEDDAERLRFIRNCRRHGMALPEIRELLKYRDAPERDCAGVSKLLERRIKSVEEQIESLNLLKEQLQKLHGECPGPARVSDCGIIRGLDGQRF